MSFRPARSPDEKGSLEVLKTKRMGHELPWMHGVYGHVSPAIRTALAGMLGALTM
jgi:hypothetical protein